jgi:hypothetical protein
VTRRKPRLTRARPMAAGLAALALGALPAAAQQAGYTFYQDGRVLARRVFPGAVPAGVSTRAVDLGQVDLGSVMSLDPAIRISGGTLLPAASADAALRRAVGKELRFAREKDTVRATVLSAEPVRVRLADGSVMFGLPGTPLFPADLAGGDAALTLGLNATSARPALPLAWYAQGGGWTANYTVVLGDKPSSQAAIQPSRVSGVAVVNAGSIDAEEAEIQLLAGNIGFEGGMPRPMMARGQAMEEAAVFDKATEQAVGEAHLYTLPGRHALQRGSQLAVALFEPVEVRAEKGYTVSGAVPMYGPLQQYGDGSIEVPVAVTWVLPRALKTTFGDLPLPGGTWRLFEADREGRLQLVGVAGTGHEAAGQQVRLNTGTAFDLSARMTQAEYTQVREGRKTVATADFRWTLANAGAVESTIDVLEQRGGEWSVLSSSVPAEKLSSTVTRFRVKVPAGGEATLTYRVRAAW